ncbi:MAG: DUF1194 domain-containing protein [Alphaproteobacteria bacterium]|nr:DUF1194 domain-containing protein [Alphaproteobacteria bacterium]
MRRILALLVFLFAASPAAAIPVDLELVLAVDVSRSIDQDEAQLQREGYVRALTDERVIQAIRSGLHGRIAIAYVEWAAAHLQFTLIGWTLIKDRASAETFAGKLAEMPIQAHSRTSISGAIDYSARLFANNGYEGERLVIDVSGDGRNNDGRPAHLARNEAVAKGITINGLPILNDRPTFGFPADANLDTYYETDVIGGPGAFMVVAQGFDAFAAAIMSKLIREIAQLTSDKGPEDLRQ